MECRWRVVIPPAAFKPGRKSKWTVKRAIRNDAQAGLKLVVPQMEKVGALRQSSTPKARHDLLDGLLEPEHSR
jgi:hypothetical protein